MDYRFSSMTLKERYEWIRIMEKDPKAKDRNSALAVLISELKADTRKMNRIITTKHLVRDLGDSAIILMQFPDSIKTEEEAERYFRNYEYMEYRNSEYDCTGQMFTNWYKIFRRNGKMFAYHAFSIDV